MGEKTLLFQAAIQKENDITECYFVEADSMNHYFKYGISKTSGAVENFNNNRLTIISTTKTYYNNFKSAFLSYTGAAYGIGQENDVLFTYTFEDEIYKEPKVYDFSDINQLFDDYFHDLIRTTMNELDDLFIRDRMTIHDKEIIIFHDDVYASIYDERYANVKNRYALYPESELDKLEELRKEYFDYTEKNENPNNSLQRTLIANHCDLMVEYLNRKKTGKIPIDPLSVDGWTADDLSVFAYDTASPWIETYNLMAKVRAEDPFAKEELRIMTSDTCPYLYINDDDTECQVDNKYKQFLQKYTAKMIKSELKQYIVGQDELIDVVSSYIYYHILKQVHKNLFPRTLLIAGPSGSGKTEVWRVAKKLYGEYFDIHIVDGASITQEGYKGDRKINTYLQCLLNGDVLVVDEFDKLATPSYSGHGENVSQQIQGEFLKILEGEYYAKDLNLKTDFQTIGIVLVGSFDEIRHAKNSKQAAIGFQNEKKENNDVLQTITDNELINFGVIPELVGRVSDKCITEALSPRQYVEIIKNKNSRIGTLFETLKSLKIDPVDMIDDKEILDLAKSPETAKMGVRWVQSKVEKKLINLLMGTDLRKEFQAKY